MSHLTTKKRPHSDFDKPKAPSHDYPYTWLGDPPCMRCGLPMSMADSKPCYTDAQLRDARIMGGILDRMRHG